MKVSVLMLSYNHGKYIQQAIDSVLMQQVDFPIELVIGDDCSTDDSREILLEYERKNPGTIRLLPSECNLGMNKNYARTLQACTGQYIAILEGDDFWTSPDKLRKQVDFLDRHPECTICFHNVLVTKEDGRTIIKEGVWPGQKEISTLEDLVQHNFTVHCSVMFRSGYISNFPEWWYRVRNIDWFVHIFNAEHGHIGYIPEVMAVYRQQPEGIWTKLSFPEIILARTLGYELINLYFKNKYDGVISPILTKHWQSLKNIYTEKGFQVGLADARLENVLKIFENWPVDLPLRPRWKAEVLGEIYARLLFQNRQDHHPEVVRYCCVQLVRYEPSRFRNRGILKVCLEAYLGRGLIS